MPCKISAFVLQKSDLCSLSPTETPLNETLTPAGILTSYPLHVSFHALLAPAGWRSHVKTMAEGGNAVAASQPSEEGEGYDLHSLWNAQRTASGCWPHSHQLP